MKATNDQRSPSTAISRQPAVGESTVRSTAELAAHANVKAEAYDAGSDRDGFWARAAERLPWDTNRDRVLDGDAAPFAKWFVGGRLNAAYNCLDRHVEAGNGVRVAIYLPMIPEAVTTMLACARIGGSASLRRGAGLPHRRLRGKLVVTADGGYRRGSASALKPAVDEAIAALGKNNPVDHVRCSRRRTSSRDSDLPVGGESRKVRGRWRSR